MTENQLKEEKTLQDYETILKDMDFCPSCEGSLTHLKGYPDYPHESGKQIGDSKYWLYKVCTKCGYQWAYWKLENRLDQLVECTHCKKKRIEIYESYFNLSGRRIKDIKICKSCFDFLWNLDNLFTMLLCQITPWR